jgi:ketosteroid isomerase-like protein
MTTTEDQIRDLGRRWADAEVRADVATLDQLSADDFTLVGPAGFVLTKQQWLDRYRPGGQLSTSKLEWHDVAVRDYGSAAVAVGVHTQEASYDGHPANGAFRATHVLIRSGDRWLLAGMQLSPIGGPPPFARPQ